MTIAPFVVSSLTLYSWSATLSAERRSPESLPPWPWANACALHRSRRTTTARMSAYYLRSHRTRRLQHDDYAPQLTLDRDRDRASSAPGGSASIAASCWPPRPCRAYVLRTPPRVRGAGSAR